MDIAQQSTFPKQTRLYITKPVTLSFLQRVFTRTPHQSPCPNLVATKYPTLYAGTSDYVLNILVSLSDI